MIRRSACGPWVETRKRGIAEWFTDDFSEFSLKWAPRRTRSPSSTLLTPTRKTVLPTVSRKAVWGKSSRLAWRTSSSCCDPRACPATRTFRFGCSSLRRRRAEASCRLRSLGSRRKDGAAFDGIRLLFPCTESHRSVHYETPPAFFFFPFWCTQERSSILHSGWQGVPYPMERRVASLPLKVVQARSIFSALASAQHCAGRRSRADICKLPRHDSYAEGSVWFRTFRLRGRPLICSYLFFVIASFSIGHCTSPPRLILVKPVQSQMIWLRSTIPCVFVA